VTAAPAHTDTRAFEPADARCAERVRASFARQGAVGLVGAELIALAPGYCSIALVARPELAQRADG